MNELEIALTEGAYVRVKDPFPPEGVVDRICQREDGTPVVEVVRFNNAGEKLTSEHTFDEVEASSDYAEFLAGLIRYTKANPNQRAGQAAYNYAYSVRPDVVEATPRALDPFNNDASLAAFLTNIWEHW